MTVRRGSSLELAKTIVAVLEDRKGREIVVLDVRRLSEITDFFVLVSGTSRPHLKAMSEELERRMEEAGINCYRRAGTPESGWVVIDYIDVITHIFLPKTREYYGIEKLWAAAPRAH